MDVIVKTWNTKVVKKNSENPNRDKSSSMSKSSKTTERKKFRCQTSKNKNASLSTLAKSTQYSCCQCCGVLVEYIKEVIKLICSGCNSETKIAELLKELVDIAACICHDCYSVLKHIIRFLIVTK